jgi:hypothetical protein
MRRVQTRAGSRGPTRRRPRFADIDNAAVRRAWVDGSGDHRRKFGALIPRRHDKTDTGVPCKALPVRLRCRKSARTEIDDAQQRGAYMESGSKPIEFISVLIKKWLRPADRPLSGLWVPISRRVPILGVPPGWGYRCAALACLPSPAEVTAPLRAMTAVAGLVRRWARDLGPRNILVNVIQPGPRSIPT